MMKNTSQGFTLIELLIVIAILFILSTMALPSYQDRVIRAQVEQAMTMAEVAKKDIQDYYRAKGSLPKNNAQAGLPSADKFVGNFVKSIQVNDGAIDIMFGNRVNKNAESKLLSIRPAVVSGAQVVPISWVCGYASVPKGMTVKGKNGSTILPRQLPVDCRY
jgi:type IV pilus assembly protein PilA